MKKLKLSALAVLFLSATTIAFASAHEYRCDVGSKEPVRYHDHSVYMDGEVVYVYGSIYSDQRLSDDDIQSNNLCRRYAQVDQTCEVLGCFKTAYSGLCPQGEVYRCRPHPKIGEICSCVRRS